MCDDQGMPQDHRTSAFHLTHGPTSHDLALGAYEQLRIFTDPSVSDDDRCSALEALIELRCNHGDLVVRRALQAAVEDAIEAAIHQLAMEDQSDDPGSFSEPYVSLNLSDRCLFCAEELGGHGADCPALG